jgi:hypothetical protein
MATHLDADSKHAFLLNAQILLALANLLFQRELLYEYIMYVSEHDANSEI